MNNIILLGLVSFINDLSSKMILPILPLFIEQLGGAGLAIGVISGIGTSISSFLKVLSGYWSDKIGRRKPFVLSGYAVSAVSKLLFYFAHAWPAVLIFRSIERTGKGLRSAARDSMIAATAEKEKSGKAFGIHRAFDSGGSVLGSIVVLLLLLFLNIELRTVFLIAGIIAFFSLIPIFFTRETGTQKKATKTRLVLNFKKLSPKLKFFMVIATVFALGNFSWMFFVLKAQNVFAGEQVFVIPIVLYLIYQVAYTLFAIPSGMWADRIGKSKVLMVGYALFGLVALGFIFFSSLESYIVLFILYGIMYAFVNANERAYVSDLSAQEIKGTALGTFYTLTSIAALPAGIVAGLLYDIASEYAFLYGAVAAFITVLLFMIHTYRNRLTVDTTAELG